MSEMKNIVQRYTLGHGDYVTYENYQDLSNELKSALERIQELEKTSPSGRMALQIGALKDENLFLHDKIEAYGNEITKLTTANKELIEALETFVEDASKPFPHGGYFVSEETCLKILTALKKHNGELL